MSNHSSQSITLGPKERAIYLSILSNKKMPAELKARCMDDFYRYKTLTLVNAVQYREYLCQS